MKQLAVFLITFFVVSGLSAQYIYNDFDTNQNEDFLGWPGLPVITANPDPSGVNTSPNVAQWERTGEQWAHVYCNLDGKIDFTTGTAFNVKVYSPIACDVLFKLEDQANGSIFTELTSSITATDQWVELEFDFTNGQSGLYDKIVVFFDFASTTSNIFYFDDVTGPEYGAGVEPKPYLALDVQDNFENDGWSTIEDWKFQDTELVDLSVTADPVDPTNNVADYNRSGNFEYTNAQFILDHRMDLTIRNKFELKVFFPSSNDYTGLMTPTAAIKLQNSLLGGNAWMTQTEVIQTVTTFDSWVTFTFDFSAAADSMNYDQVVVQMGGEGHLVPGQFYFDDIFLLGSSGNGTLTFNPPDGATNIDISVNPTLSFSVPITLANGDEITNSDIASLVTFKLDDAGGANVAYTGSINNEKTVITIDPDDELLNAQMYYLGLGDAVIRYVDADLIPAQNITFTTETGPKPYLALPVQDNFENNGWGTISNWKFQDPELLDLEITTDPQNAANHVADYNRSGSFEWTNAQFILDHRMDLSNMNIFELSVYLPSSNDYSGLLTPTAAIKLQNSLLGPDAWTTQTEIKLTVTDFDAWVTLEFEFAGIADSVNYDQVVVQIGGEGHLVPAQFYFDDLMLKQVVGVTKNPGNQSKLFPNPVNDYLHISGNENISNVVIRNMAGQIVLQQSLNVLRVNVTNLNPGIYTIELKEDNKTISYHKFIRK
jgi:hypothetical protein